MNRLLRELARTLRHEVLWDEGVEAARNACVAGAPISAALITAAAYYDNPFTGVRALVECMHRITSVPLEISDLHDSLANSPQPEADGLAFTPGFGFVTEAQAAYLRRKLGGWLRRHAALSRLERSALLAEHYSALCEAIGWLNPAGLTAFVFSDLGLSPDDAERWYLRVRLGPALRQAQRARQLGVGRFPFFSERYVYEGTWPEPVELDLSSLMQQVGID